MPDNHDSSDYSTPNDEPTDDRIDGLARHAGEALRRPAPIDGIERLRAGRRRQQTTRLLAGGTAAALVVVGVFLVVNRGGDDPGTLVPAEPTAPSSEVPSSEVPSSEVPSSEVPPSEVPPSEVPPSLAPLAPGWQPAVDPFPDLAYIACCGTNWLGDPSPAIQDDPDAPLQPGTYNLGWGAQTTDDFTDGVVTLEIRPFVRCGDVVDDGFCAGADWDPDTSLGVPADPARTVDLVLDDTIRVAMSGFACVAGEDQMLVANEQIGSGPDLVALANELDAAYRSAIETPLLAGTPPEQIVADLGANPTAGFSDPGCDIWTNIVWTPSSGPAILPQSISRLDDAAVPQPFPSASVELIRATALHVDGDGRSTLYFYAGFLS